MSTDRGPPEASLTQRGHELLGEDTEEWEPLSLTKDPGVRSRFDLPRWEADEAPTWRPFRQDSYRRRVPM